jgi:hypothetical protein
VCASEAIADAVEHLLMDDGYRHPGDHREVLTFAMRPFGLEVFGRPARALKLAVGWVILIRGNRAMARRYSVAHASSSRIVASAPAETARCHAVRVNIPGE